MLSVVFNFIAAIKRGRKFSFLRFSVCEWSSVSYRVISSCNRLLIERLSCFSVLLNENNLLVGVSKCFFFQDFLFEFCLL